MFRLREECLLGVGVGVSVGEDVRDVGVSEKGTRVSRWVKEAIRLGRIRLGWVRIS